MSKVFIGKAEQCLEETKNLCYAYFSPELDNFTGEEITVDDVLFKVLCEIDLLDDGYLQEHAKDSEYPWNANRNKAWRKRAISFLRKWSIEVPLDNRIKYLSIA